MTFTTAYLTVRYGRYEVNKTECRKDIEAFNQLVYAAEDERVTGGTADETEK